MTLRGERRAPTGARGRHCCGGARIETTVVQGGAVCTGSSTRARPAATRNGVVARARHCGGCLSLALRQAHGAGSAT